MIRSWLFLVFAGAFLLAPGVAAEQSAAARRAAIDAMYPVMIKAVETGNFGQARNICDQALMWEPENPVHHYNLACIEARAGGARLPYALPARLRAAQLGFNEIGTVKNDPDLEPLRKDPRFAEVVQLVARNAEAAAASSTAASSDGAAPAARAPAAAHHASVADTPPAAVPPPSPRGMVSLAVLSNVEKPAAASFKQGAPVGLFFMTRFWSFTGTLEKLVWYFAPDGTVYQSLEHGFSEADLAAHAGPKGVCKVDGDTLEVQWAKGKKSAARIERKDTGFFWDGGNFTPVQPFDPSHSIVGTYEGGESISFSGNRAAISKTLELRADGTFRWSGVSFLSSTTDASRVTAGSNGVDSTGRWRATGYSLVLVDEQGNVYRRIAFPYDDKNTPVNPDRIFFGGTMFKRQ